jgi:hypothetical protein
VKFDLGSEHLVGCEALPGKGLMATVLPITVMLG